jgi:hypothetical protein
VIEVASGGVELTAELESDLVLDNRAEHVEPSTFWRGGVERG